MQRSDAPGDPRHHHLAWPHRRFRRPAASASGAVGGACRSSSSTARFTGRSSDARWHECGHGTAFRTRWMNEVIYQIASFMIMRNPVTWRWSHARHHTDTIIVGRDVEIAVMRPPDLVAAHVQFLRHRRCLVTRCHPSAQCAGQVERREKSFIPEMERAKAVTAAQVHIAIYGATIALALYLGSVAPARCLSAFRAFMAHGTGAGRAAATWRACRQRDRPSVEHVALCT